MSIEASIQPSKDERFITDRWNSIWVFAQPNWVTEPLTPGISASILTDDVLQSLSRAPKTTAEVFYWVRRFGSAKDEDPLVRALDSNHLGDENGVVFIHPGAFETLHRLSRHGYLEQRVVVKLTKDFGSVDELHDKLGAIYKLPWRPKGLMSSLAAILRAEPPTEQEMLWKKLAKLGHGLRKSTAWRLSDNAPPRGHRERATDLANEKLPSLVWVRGQPI